MRNFAKCALVAVVCLFGVSLFAAKPPTPVTGPSTGPVKFGAPGERKGQVEGKANPPGQEKYHKRPGYMKHHGVVTSPSTAPITSATGPTTSPDTGPVIGPATGPSTGGDDGSSVSPT